ncbi:collagen binding domain-containing protein [Massilia sp. TS11]|uniref:MSCRAMM family protein n=1 Tax=Massilia sp. TS11 TaxID=2908003 RepID=UPI001EDC1127|nr:hypothetical protein [Massilia sp. TS11]MCG2586475.1 hypothetical protein [Massilia sp. TS11]
MRRLRRALAATALLAALAAQAAEAPFPDTSLVLLEVRLGQDALTDSFSAYQLGRQTFLPLGELARLLTIAVRAQPEQGTASGFILQEGRGFRLDARAGLVTLGERSERFDPALVRVAEDDIYVDSSLLARWFPVDLSLDLSSLALLVTAREPLPLQLRLKREQAAAQAGTSGAYVDPHYPRVAPRYALASVPMIDQTFGLNMARSSGSRQRELSSTTFLAGDLLGMQAQMFIAGGSSGAAGTNSRRLTLGRDDPEGGLLGPLGARSLALGSVAVPGLAQVTRSSPTGNGLAISNLPLNRASSFDRHTFQGDLPPGWDVELFFNEALVGFQQSRADGKYVFADRPLVYGANNFRLVFHGPQGQLRVERQTFLLDDSALVPGQLFYTLAAHRTADGYRHALGQVQLGISRALALNAAVLQSESQSGLQQYQKAGLLLYGGPAIATLDLVQQQGGGRLLDLGVKTRAGALLISGNHTRLQDFSSDVYVASADPVRQRDALRLDGLLPLDVLRRMPLTLELTRDRLQSGQSNQQLAAQAVGYLQGLAVTNQLAWNRLGEQRNTSGSLQLASLWRDVGLRGQFGYTLRPERRLATIGAAADKPLGEEMRLGLDLVRQLDNPDTRLTASLTKSLGSFGYALTLMRSKGSLALGAQLFISAAREPRSARWQTSAQPMANMGALAARVFVDRNLNGVMDADEAPVRLAGVNINGVLQPARSDADGLLLLPQLAPNQYADVAVNIGTLEDPQWTPAPRGLRVLPRAGHVETLELPLALTAEIDGTVSVAGKAKGAGDLTLELLDARGQVVNTASTAADGFYIVQFVLPGTYTLRVAPQQLERLGLQAPARTVTIGSDGRFLNGQDFILRPR